MRCHPLAWIDLRPGETNRVISTIADRQMAEELQLLPFAANIRLAAATQELGSAGSLAEEKRHLEVRGGGWCAVKKLLRRAVAARIRGPRVCMPPANETGIGRMRIRRWTGISVINCGRTD